MLGGIVMTEDEIIALSKDEREFLNIYRNLQGISKPIAFKVLENYASRCGEDSFYGSVVNFGHIQSIVINNDHKKAPDHD